MFERIKSVSETRNQCGGQGRLSPPTKDPSFDNQVRNPLNSQHGDRS